MQSESCFQPDSCAKFIVTWCCLWDRLDRRHSSQSTKRPLQQECLWCWQQTLYGHLSHLCCSPGHLHIEKYMAMPRICRSHPACCSELEDSLVARGTFCETLGEELSCGRRKIKQKHGQHRVLTCSQMYRACSGWGRVIPKWITGLEISRSGILLSCWFFHWFLSARQVYMEMNQVLTNSAQVPCAVRTLSP